MKTTSKITLEKRIQKLVDSRDVSKNSLVYGWINELVLGERKFRPVFSQGSTWKHSSLIDKTGEFTRVLNLLNINYSLTNDAPRGGKTGALITIETKVKQ